MVHGRYTCPAYASTWSGLFVISYDALPPDRGPLLSKAKQQLADLERFRGETTRRAQLLESRRSLR